MGSISDSDLPRDILSSLRNQAKGCSQLGRMSERLSVDLQSHKKSVSAIQWSPTHGYCSYQKIVEIFVCSLISYWCHFLLWLAVLIPPCICGENLFIVFCGVFFFFFDQ